ncbi:MAG: DUF5916 domain-containing protein [Bacteroidales bacterium]
MTHKTPSPLFFLLIFLIFPLGVKATNNKTFDFLSTRDSVSHSNVKVVGFRQTTEKITIDGKLDENIWKKRPQIHKLVEYSPNPGKVDKKHPTKVWLYYDQEAIYCAAELTEDPSEFYKDFTKRDDIGNSDFFGLLLDTYQDRINGYEFGVTSSGQQVDTKYSSSGGDRKWDAVWYSATSSENGKWTLEMKIPYSAIRFSNNKEQIWGFNIRRYRMAERQESYWNERHPSKSNYVAQWGTSRGIKQIKPPVLLSLSPYISAFVDHTEENGGIWHQGYSAGMDLQWGINRSFTLDATLIPDFGQVSSDNTVYNLSPFEVTYSEKRPFFLKGMGLFSKGGLLYSRRIGGTPHFLNNLDDKVSTGDEILDNPSESRMINAFKFKGRTNGGLGIGVMNALTAQTFAKYKDAETGEIHNVLTDPLTNYNMLVLDQSLANNSYITLINASTYRKAEYYDADILALQFHFNDKNNKYYISGKGVGSFFTNKNSGYKYDFGVGKGNGRFRWQLSHSLKDNKIDINDMGIQKERNRISESASVSYRGYKPTDWYRSFYTGIWADLSHRYTTGKFESNSYGGSANITLINITSLNVGVSYTPLQHNFYEPRKEGRYLEKRNSLWLSTSMSTNYSKTFFYDISANYAQCEEPFNMTRYRLWINPGFRLSRKCLLRVGAGIDDYTDDVGYYSKNSAEAFSSSDTVLMSHRNRRIYETKLNMVYAFNKEMNISLGARHYVSKVKNKDLHILNDNGTLSPSDIEPISGIIYNSFYLDFIYTWRFAPGSELDFIWKNNINPDTIYFEDRSYLKDVNAIFDGCKSNNIMLKLIYYFDWNRLRRKS